MTVAQNIAYPLRVRRASRAAQQEAASRTSAGLGLAELLDRRPGQLSGGQQQRVALARAIAMEADLLLLDEPLSNLDARLRLEARTFLKRLQRELGLTTVFVTHDQAEALALADRIAVMSDGRIRQLGSPKEVFQRPGDAFVANFIGSTPMNLLPGTVSGGLVVAAGARLKPPAGLDLADGTPVTVGIRPEYLHTSAPASADGLTGKVSIVENLGVTSLVTLECPGEVLVGVTVPEQAEPEVGSTVTAVPDPGRLLLYSGETDELLGEAAVAKA
jgi:multiple sugar transport system ATP-binding protein